MATNNSPAKKFAIYARVSTEGQAATGGSLDNERPRSKLRGIKSEMVRSKLRGMDP